MVKMTADKTHIAKAVTVVTEAGYKVS